MKRFLGFGLFLWMSTAQTQAAVVYLKDGSQVRGTIVSATARDLQVHTVDGRLSISTERIQRIDYAEVERASSDPVVPSLVRHPVSPPDPDSYRQFFAVGMGVGAPMSRMDFTSTGGGTATNGGAGFHLTTQYLHSLTSRWSAGMNVEFMNRGSETQSLLPNSTTEVSGNSLLMLAAVKYALTDRGSVRPYVMGGVGPHYTSTVVDATPNAEYMWDDSDSWETRTLVDQRHWGIATTARLGLDFLVSPESTLGLELGWTRMMTDDYAATSAGRDLGLESVTGNQNALTFAVRWGWRF